MPLPQTPTNHLNLPLPQTPTNHLSLPTTTLTQEGFIVVEVTTTVDSLPSMLGHLSPEPSASYVPQQFATNNVAFSAMRPTPSIAPPVHLDSSTSVDVQIASTTTISSPKPSKSTRAGIERKGNSHTNTTYRLSDGYVVLIAIAILFVSAVLLYFYMRRRKHNRRRMVVTSGRSILSSSNSGPPSVGVEEEKYFTAGSRPGARNLPPDSGASVDYQNKDTKLTQTTNVNYYEQPCQVSAKSDIYDCVSNGKQQINLEPNMRTAAKRGAISFDHIKLHPLPSIPMRGDTSLEPQKVRLNEHQNTHLPEIDPKNPLLDTTLANPLGIKIKPRKLTRDSVKRANSSNSRQTVNANSTIRHLHLPAEDKKQPAHPASTFNQPPLVSPPDTPQTDKQQNREAPNFISLVDSIESLSESYQFAVRHKPPLGPLHVVEPHTPALPDELRIKRGEELFVIGEFADGWVLAINVSRSSECGMIPRRCLFFPTAPFMSQKSVMEPLTPPDAQSPTSSI
ncbi:hypothetical protein EV183_000972 [Coemansia sp. RSA 2336]|nr:hypothetical protein EV183_000972 [Coemansia sp. RSA 2336]